MEEYTRLLARQIKHHLNEKSFPLPVDFQCLLEAINQSYLHYERDNILGKRSLEISSAEMQELVLDLANKEEFTRAILESTSDGILVLNNKNQIETCNSSMAHFLGLQDQSQAVGKSISTFISLPYQQGIYELSINRPDGSTLPVEISAAEITEDHKQLRIHVVRDISIRKEQELLQRYFEAKLTFQATHDLLTGLPNRMLLIDRLEQSMYQNKRDKTHIAVIFLDLDRFKIVNDTLGHNFGDELLKEVSIRLQGCKRESDTLCRVGGDEFIMIMPGLREENSSLIAIKRIQEALKEPFNVNSQQINITGSIGISFYPKNGDTADELLQNADTAMYKAKSLGKNIFQYYTEEMNVQMRERLDLEQNLFLAYKLGELLLYYQPIIEASTGKIKGTEALLRWLHPQAGMIAPQKFISVAEETGLIIPVGEWVLRTACAQNLYWQKMGLPAIPIAVNLSGYQLRSGDTAAMIERVLDDIGYDGKYLELELTENVLMETDPEVQKVFKRLKEKGVCFVIDDFGTGYSNLNYLVQYPISKLKIDKSFIEQVTTIPLEASVVQAIISMAHSLKMIVVAEGVETESQYRFLCENNCDEIQGFYFSKPVDTNAYTALLKEGIVDSVQNFTF